MTHYQSLARMAPRARTDQRYLTVRKRSPSDRRPPLDLQYLADRVPVRVSRIAPLGSPVLSSSHIATFCRTNPLGYQTECGGIGPLHIPLPPDINLP